MPQLNCILLVDDDQTTNYLSQLLLRRLGVTDNVLVALNGQEALDLLHVHCQDATPDCPALILLDVKMPVMNGFQFLEAYAHLPLAERGAIVIIMLTTSLHPLDVERMQHLEIAGSINKPLTPEKINDILRAHFPPAG